MKLLSGINQNASKFFWRTVEKIWSMIQYREIKYFMISGSVNLNATTHEGETALWLAVKNNSHQSASLLMQSKAAVNIPTNEDISPLHCASSKGLLEVTKMLIAKGSTVNSTDFGLSTPLHEAAISGHCNIAEVLLHNGADISKQDCHGRTPLFCAAQSNLHSCQVLKLLLNLSTPSVINMRAFDGASAVMVASQAGCYECVKLLIEHGGNANLKADDGVMAIHLALTGSHKNILKYLLEETDHSYIEQSCLADHHGHKNMCNSRQVLLGNETRNQELLRPINIFHLAVCYDRMYLIETLLEGGLEADRYPIEWGQSERDRQLPLKQFLNFKWTTPLSHLLSQRPFDETVLKAVVALVRAGSNVNEMRPGFIPPLLELVLARGWVESLEELPRLLVALELLTDHGAQVAQCSNSRMNAIVGALCFSPPACLALLRLGYIISAKDATEVAYLESVAVHSGYRQHVWKQTEALLLAAGLRPSRSIVSLRELSRKQVLQMLSRSKLKSIRSVELPLPATLIEYLCFDDFSFPNISRTIA